jgi:hypothetical protein
MREPQPETYSIANWKPTHFFSQSPFRSWRFLINTGQDGKAALGLKLGDLFAQSGCVIFTPSASVMAAICSGISGSDRDFLTCIWRCSARPLSAILRVNTGGKLLRVWTGLWAR